MTFCRRPKGTRSARGEAGYVTGQAFWNFIIEMTVGSLTHLSRKRLAICWDKRGGRMIRIESASRPANESRSSKWGGYITGRQVPCQWRPVPRHLADATSNRKASSMMVATSPRGLTGWKLTRERVNVPSPAASRLAEMRASLLSGEDT